MKSHSISTFALAAVILSCGAMLLVGCKTDQAGVKSNMRTQTTVVNATIADATEAAEDVLSELDLADVTSSATKLQGKASGKDVDGTKVRVDIERETDTTSKVSVTVGKIGDNDTGKRVATMIRSKFADAKMEEVKEEKDMQ